VVKNGLLPSPTSPKSKLKLNGVLPGTGTLYGPKQVTFQIKNKKYDFPDYESEIEEDCILGLNFIQTYYSLCDPGPDPEMAKGEGTWHRADMRVAYLLKQKLVIMIVYCVYKRKIRIILKCTVILKSVCSI